MTIFDETQQSKMLACKLDSNTSKHFPDRERRLPETRRVYNSPTTTRNVIRGVVKLESWTVSRTVDHF